tara:strand:- start:2575 stop:2808 length:234 start_codon:yes stop_codon:yes gene_type:complete
VIMNPNVNADEQGSRLTLLQCLVGGFVGFGLLTAVLCFMVGGGIAFWLSMTTFLTVGYTIVYLIRTRNERKSDPETE